MGEWWTESSTPLPFRETRVALFLASCHENISTPSRERCWKHCEHYHRTFQVFHDRFPVCISAARQTLTRTVAARLPERLAGEVSDTLPAMVSRQFRGRGEYPVF